MTPGDYRCTIAARLMSLDYALQTLFSTVAYVYIATRPVFFTLGLSSRFTGKVWRDYSARACPGLKPRAYNVVRSTVAVDLSCRPRALEAPGFSRGRGVHKGTSVDRHGRSIVPTALV